MLEQVTITSPIFKKAIRKIFIHWSWEDALNNVDESECIENGNSFKIVGAVERNIQDHEDYHTLYFKWGDIYFSVDHGGEYDTDHDHMRFDSNGSLVFPRVWPYEVVTTEYRNTPPASEK